MSLDEREGSTFSQSQLVSGVYGTWYIVLFKKKETFV